MGRPVRRAAGGPPPPEEWPDWVLKPPVSSTDPTSQPNNRAAHAAFAQWRCDKANWLRRQGMARLPMPEHQIELRRRFPPTDRLPRPTTRETP